MICKPSLPLIMMAMSLMVHLGNAQDSRTINGEILSEEDTPIPGLAVIQLGTDNAVVTDLNGQFKLTVADTGKVYVHVFGQDLEIFLKYEEEETSKTVSLTDWKRLKRNNKKIINEWTARNNK